MHINDTCLTCRHPVGTDSMGGKPVQVRVTQGKEPAHFRQLFKGNMIVFRGGNASGFANAAASTEEQGDVALFHIKGTNALNTVALEVTPSATELNSDDSFVLVTPEKVILSFVFINYKLYGTFYFLFCLTTTDVYVCRCMCGKVTEPMPTSSPWPLTPPPPWQVATRAPGAGRW